MNGAPLGNVNVILHGLLFLEFKSTPQLNWLEITAPDLHSNHDLLMGVPGNLQNINYSNIDWRSLPGLQGGDPGKLIGGVPEDVPDKIFQFGRTETAVGDIDLPGNQGKIFLPWPADWTVVRKGNLPALATRLPMKPPGQQVQTSIRQRCGSVIGVAAALTYTYPINLLPIPGWSPTTNIEVYFQPKSREQITDVNADLRAASSDLFSSDNFDLQMDTTVPNPNASTPIGQTTYPDHSGLSTDDETSLGEVLRVVDPSQVAGNIRDSLLTLESFLLEFDTASKGTETTVAGGLRQGDSHRAKGSGSREPAVAASIMMASPANCPILFLGG